MSQDGLVNTVKYGRRITGAKRLYGWIGGTHLGPVNEDQQNKTLEALEGFQPEFVLAAHCTGFPMMAELHRKFGKRFIPGFVGTSIEF